jgi:serine/threonine protein kinase
MDDETQTATDSAPSPTLNLEVLVRRLRTVWLRSGLVLSAVFMGVLLVVAGVVSAMGVPNAGLIPWAAALMVTTAAAQPMHRWIVRRWPVVQPLSDETQTSERNASYLAALSDKPTQTLASSSPDLDGLSVLGVYHLSMILGRGGMGKVYLAQDVRDGRKVAVKVLSVEMARREDMLKRFQREVSALQKLSHPNIVQMIESGFEQGVHYLAMEWVDGLSLRERLRREKRMALTEAVLLLADIAAGLDAAHAVGIVHRDVKPSNILLRRLPDRVQGVLSDFGIAKLAEDHSGKLTDLNVVGSLDTIAPEQVVSTREVDWRADLYALGVVAYQLLTGHHPYEGTARTAMLMAHLRQTPIDPRVFLPDVPKPVAQVLLKALSKRPEQRPTTARELVRPLEEAYL